MKKLNKIPHIDYVPIIVITFIIYRMVNNVENVGSIISGILSLLSYFIWGFVIAYLLNPLMVFIEDKTHLKRLYSIGIIYILFIGIIILTLTLLTPSLIKSALDLFNNMPQFANKSYDWITNFIANNQIFNKFDVTNYVENYLKNFNNNIITYFTPGLQIVINNLMSISSLFFKLITGIVISVYLLLDKESIILNLKKFTYSILNNSQGEKVINFGRLVNTIFNKYFIGKIIDSAIFGIITFIGFFILSVPYALPFSIFIAITNMIPYFGNIIGMVPATIITIFFSPIKSVEIVLFILTLSNIDGWFISPKIIGSKIGLSPLLIILGIALGGGIFGIVGMLLGVPTTALIKTLLENFVNNRLVEKGIEEIK